MWQENRLKCPFIFLNKRLSALLRRADLTGITPQILEANNARSFPEVWPLFASWLREIDAEVAGGRGLVLVAHNAKFDNNFLAEELARGGFDRYSTSVGASISRW